MGKFATYEYFSEPQAYTLSVPKREPMYYYPRTVRHLGPNAYTREQVRVAAAVELIRRVVADLDID